jgi:carbonic anhydrase
MKSQLSTFTRTFITAAALALGVQTSTFAADHAGSGISPDAGLAKLMAGNARFAKGGVSHPNQGSSRRAEVAKGQKPFAIVVGCSDSRTSPEIVFDQGLGDVFVTRLAGSIVDDAALGSIEYGVDHLGASVIVVLGHERCGAVDAAMKGGKAPGKIGSVVKPILPAVKAVKKTGSPTLDATIDENARRVAAGLTVRSTILSDRVKAGKLKIVAARYDLETGRVTIVR